MMCTDREFSSVLGMYEFRIHAAYCAYSIHFLRSVFRGYVPEELEVASFVPIEACRDVGRAPCDLDLDIVHLGRPAWSGEILAEMHRKRLRPVIHSELLSFVFACWHIPLVFRLVALGSFVTPDGEPHALQVYNTDGNSLALYLADYGGPYEATCRFPAVPI